MKLELRGVMLAAGEKLLCRGLDATLLPGQLWCVLGRNGCGKTTLLRTVAGLRKPDAGEIFLDGRALSAWEWRRLAQVRALLPQTTRDAFASSVLETVMSGRFPHRARGWRWPLRESVQICESESDDLDDRDESNESDDTVIARGCLAELGIAALAGRDVLTLSGGERQRVAIATLLAQTPKLALLDEPTAHLDLDVQRLAFDVIARRVARRRDPWSALVTVHDVNLAARYATHVLLFLEHGETLAGARQDVLCAANLTRVYRHPVHEISAGSERWFVAA